MSDDLRELYQEVILDHGKHPRNFRHPADANCQARGYNPLCGDQLTVYLKLGDDGVIGDAAFEGRGCAISTASASLMTELLRGKTEAQAKALFDAFHHLCTKGDEVSLPAELEEEADKLRVLSGVRQFPMRVKCATLAWHTLNAAMAGKGEVSTE
jgi:nitrogen fixation NifU-like protein